MDTETLFQWTNEARTKQGHWGGRGGIASGASRRRKKSLREAADLYLSLPPSDKRKWNELAKRGLEPDEIDNQMAMIVGLTDQAINGDAKAAKVIIDLLREKPEDEQNQNGMLANLIDGLVEDDLYTETTGIDEDIPPGEAAAD